MPLGVIGLPACAWLADPIVQLIATTNPAGMAVSTLVVPNDPALLGIALALQWLVVDPNATHGIPVALSDGLRAVFGR